MTYLIVRVAPWSLLLLGGGLFLWGAIASYKAYGRRKWPTVPVQVRKFQELPPGGWEAAVPSERPTCEVWDDALLRHLAATRHRATDASLSLERHQQRYELLMASVPEQQHIP